MKYLLDTNIVIPLEPTSNQDLEANTVRAMKLLSLCTEVSQQVFIHPAITYDIQKDKNTKRKNLRLTTIQRYPVLDSPPSATTLNPSIIPLPKAGTNDWVDHHLLAALQGDLVDYLVTEDIGIHKKGKKLGIDSRILLLHDAIALVQDLFDDSPPPPPTVKCKKVYSLDTSDPIFNSLRSDYGVTAFDNWLVKCKKNHREAYVVETDSGKLAGIVILKPEKALPDGTEGKVLKICTFKVSESHSGNRLGELLLKPVFEYLRKNGYDFAYFTAFKKQQPLIEFAHDFGFNIIPNLDSPNELALCKTIKYSKEDLISLSPLDLHIRFGPHLTSFNGNRSFVVPIKPEYHKVLFPEIGPIQQSLFSVPQKPCGNSIRKAYLCHSSIKKIKQGDNLFFYRSNYASAMTCVGIVEGTLRSSDPSSIAQFVGKRTVYSYAEIEKLCQHNEVLAIRFRTVCQFDSKITLRTLKSNGIIKGQPQSITELRESGIQWIRQQIKM
ncbi:GNAT family N-acetyltransferase [Desulfosediminicola sp.]|uniref:GNAT family N-acetyltransferase n=1 Tax=Desulfosediminicola sp. TaxID=2886825 RepID=UPI003AF2F4B5